MVAQRAGAPPPSEMLVSGIIPPLADSYFQRLETGIDLKAGLFPGETVVLTHGEETETAPAAQGGPARPSSPWSSPTRCAALTSSTS